MCACNRRWFTVSSARQVLCILHIFETLLLCFYVCFYFQYCFLFFVFSFGVCIHRFRCHMIPDWSPICGNCWHCDSIITLKVIWKIEKKQEDFIQLKWPFNPNGLTHWLVLWTFHFLSNQFKNFFMFIRRMGMVHSVHNCNHSMHITWIAFVVGHSDFNHYHKISGNSFDCWYEHFSLFLSFYYCNDY